MRLLLTVILVYFVFLPLLSQTKRALIVGIGEYPAESGWKVINGDNDVPLIMDALAYKGFLPGNVISLVNEQATKTNILSKFKQLTALSQPGDKLYIHFSTHGQWVIDTNGDEKDGKDEALIPYDTRSTFVKGEYDGKNHLIDDELFGLLSKLRAKIGKSGTLLVVLDACHSGDASRDETEENDSTVFRGTPEIFKIGEQKVFSGKPLGPLEWVVISATQDYQNNFEYKKDGEFYGSLSYAIKLTLPDMKTTDNFEEMFTKIMEKGEQMNLQRYPQRPMMEGEVFYKNQKVF